MHNDEPTLIDGLERSALVKEVAEAIADCTPPHVFGIHGDWGLGKTSFLHQVQLYLTGMCPQHSEDDVKAASNGAIPCGVHKDTIRTVWFDAWRYQNEEAPVVALLHEMRAQLSWLARMDRTIDRASEIAIRGALLSLEELTKKIGFQYSKFRDARREIDTESLATDLPSHTLRAHLDETIGKLLPRKKRGKTAPKLVVFIDDVDRCEPEAAYKLLEGLKIYLTLDNCVFVLGMNQKVIEEAIGKQLGDDANLQIIRAAAYMEKLCQNVWRLPIVRKPSRVLYDLLDENVVREWILRGVENRGCLPPNPRRLKGLANLLTRLSARLPQHIGANDDPAAIREAQLLMIVAYIYQFHHDLYVRWESDPSLYDRIFDWCRGGEIEDLPFLHSLMLPKQEVVISESTPTPQREIRTTYPDPTEARVFWIQSLILDLGSEVTSGQFERYLHGAPA